MGQGKTSGGPMRIRFSDDAFDYAVIATLMSVALCAFALQCLEYFNACR
jgi:hypothetical protein